MKMDILRNKYGWKEDSSNKWISFLFLKPVLFFKKSNLSKNESEYLALTNSPWSEISDTNAWKFTQIWGN